jgi:hypothetical protein
VSWCVMCHAASAACLQAVLQLGPLNPYLWLLATLRSILSFRFLATVIQIAVLSAGLVIFISKSLPDSAPKVHFSYLSSSRQPSRKRKKGPLAILGSIFRLFTLLCELPVSMLSGKNLYLLLGNNVTAVLVGLLFINSQNRPALQLLYFLAAGTFSSACNTSGRRFLDAAPVVNLPLRTQIRAIFTGTAKNLIVPCLKSFATTTALISVCQLATVVFSKEAELLSIFGHWSLAFLVYTFLIYLFLATVLTTTHKVTVAVFMTNWHFPVEALDEHTLCLVDALDSTRDMKLAASRDLVFVSEFDVHRRAEFWVLSQPGGHPKKFNSLMNVYSKAVAKFKDDLSQKVEKPAALETSKLLNSDFETPFQTSTPNTLQPEQLPNTPVQPMSRYRGVLFQTPQTPTIRTMESIQSPLRLEPLSHASSSQRNGAGRAPLQSALGTVKNFFESRKAEPTANSDEIPEKSIKYYAAASSVILSDAPYLSFMSSGISTLALASVAEDKYGIVQLKLQEIVSNLLSLMATVKSHEALRVHLAEAQIDADDVADVNKVLDLLLETASRSLCKIGKAFGGSLYDLKWSEKDKETLAPFVV